jgi:hypothetical protein
LYPMSSSLWYTLFKIMLDESIGKGGHNAVTYLSISITAVSQYVIACQKER